MVTMDRNISVPGSLEQLTTRENRANLGSIQTPIDVLAKRDDIAFGTARPQGTDQKHYSTGGALGSLHV